jgi:hypothetical protein
MKLWPVFLMSLPFAFAPVGCGPAEAVDSSNNSEPIGEAQQKVCTITTPDAIFGTIQSIASKASALPSYYGKIASGINAAISGLQMAGDIYLPSEVAQLSGRIDCLAVDLSWQISGVTRDHDLALLNGTLTTIDTFVKSGMPYGFNSPG